MTTELLEPPTKAPVEERGVPSDAPIGVRDLVAVPDGDVLHVGFVTEISRGWAMVRVEDEEGVNYLCVRRRKLARL